MSVIDPLAQTIVHVETVKTEKTKSKKVRVSDDYTERITKLIMGVNRVISKYPITQMTAEMPSFGAQSSKAAVGLTAGATILLSAHLTHNIPLACVSPEDLKYCLTGSYYAPKKEIMYEVCRLCGWEITYKTVNFKDKNVQPRLDATYHVLGQKLGATHFEHIADSIAAYYACSKKGLI